MIIIIITNIEGGDTYFGVDNLFCDKNKGYTNNNDNN